MNDQHEQVHQEAAMEFVGIPSAGVRERRPRFPGWAEITTAEMRSAWRRSGTTQPLGLSAWQKGRICCISGLELATYPDRSGGTGPQWHLSVTLLRQHPPDSVIRIALAAFDLEAAEEDNHEPGNARHFWMPVDPQHRVECECKADEQLVVEANGHRWTNPKEGPCLGCRTERLTGRPCSLHGARP